MDKPAVAVVGAGVMGRGIARVFAAAGHRVRLTDAQPAAVAAARSEISASLERAIARGRLDATERDALLGRLDTAPDLAAAVAGAGLVVEAVVEDVGVKQAVLGAAAAAAPVDAILATNTSALSVTEIGAATGAPERVLGLHFFNPPHRMRLVEVVVGERTAPGVIDAAEQLCRAAGQETVRVRDRPGFATSRLSALLGNEAMHMLDEGVASAEDIDRAARLGLGHPMGPLELGDLVGLDVRLGVLRHLHETLGERFRPAPLLERFVAEGRLGRKTGRGVYDYGPDYDEQE